MHETIRIVVININSPNFIMCIVSCDCNGDDGSSFLHVVLFCGEGSGEMCGIIKNSIW